jgi:predicted GIY-YIG superfamily endonuclease
VPVSGGAERRPATARRPARQTGTTYLLHFDEPFRHARHYTGWTRDLPARLEEHRRGQGARLMQAVRAAGIRFTLARIWEGTTRDREDSLKHRGSARRFCPKCGVSPGSPRLESDRRQMAGILRAEVPAQVPGYDFADWPQITSGMAPGQATELALQLWCGRQAAYAATAEAGSRTGPGAEYLSRFDTATDVDLAWQKTAREIAGLYGRAPDEFVNAWVTSVRRQPAGPEGQEDDMFGRQTRAERRREAEADRLFALADELAKQAGERPDYQREITAERAARVMRQELATPYGMGYTEDRDMSWDEYIRGEFGGELDGAKAGRGPRLSGGPLDAEIDRLAVIYPEYGPDELVPSQDRLPPEEGRRAAELQSAAHQVAADNLAGELWPEPEAVQVDAMTPEQREERDVQIADEESRRPLDTNAKADHPVIDLAGEPCDCEAGGSGRERNGIAMRAEWPPPQPGAEAELEAGG